MPVCTDQPKLRSLSHDFVGARNAGSSLACPIYQGSISCHMAYWSSHVCVCVCVCVCVHRSIWEKTKSPFRLGVIPQPTVCLGSIWLPLSQCQTHGTPRTRSVSVPLAPVISQLSREPWNPPLFPQPYICMYVGVYVGVYTVCQSYYLILFVCMYVCMYQ